MEKKEKMKQKKVRPTWTFSDDDSCPHRVSKGYKKNVLKLPEIEIEVITTDDDHTGSVYSTKRQKLGDETQKDFSEDSFLMGSFSNSTLENKWLLEF